MECKPRVKPPKWGTVTPPPFPTTEVKKVRDSGRGGTTRCVLSQPSDDFSDENSFINLMSSILPKDIEIGLIELIEERQRWAVPAFSISFRCSIYENAGEIVGFSEEEGNEPIEITTSIDVIQKVIASPDPINAVLDAMKNADIRFTSSGNREAFRYIRDEISHLMNRIPEHGRFENVRLGLCSALESLDAADQSDRWYNPVFPRSSGSFEQFLVEAVYYLEDSLDECRVGGRGLNQIAEDISSIAVSLNRQYRIVVVDVLLYALARGMSENEMNLISDCREQGRIDIREGKYSEGMNHFIEAFRIGTGYLPDEVACVPVLRENEVFGVDRPLFEGIARAGSEIMLFVDGFHSGFGSVNQDGGFSIQPDFPLFEGPHLVSITATSTTGSLTSESHLVIVDTELLTPNVISPQFGERYLDPEVAVSGFLGEEGVKIVTVLDCGYHNETWSDSAGCFSYILPVLSDGSHKLLIFAIDKAGNETMSEVIRFNVGPEVFKPTIIEPEHGEVIIGHTITVRGKGILPGSTVEILLDHSSIGFATAESDGSFVFEYKRSKGKRKECSLVVSGLNQNDEFMTSDRVHFFWKHRGMRKAEQKYTRGRSKSVPPSKK